MLPDNHLEASVLFRIPSSLSRLISRVLSLANTLFSGKVLGVRAICINEHNQIYLVRHRYTNGWHLPGGGVNNGMSPEEAIRKEAWEEAKLVPETDPELIQIYLNERASKPEYIILYQFQVGSNDNKTDSYEIAEGKFFSFGNLPSEIDRPTFQRISEFIGKTPPGSTW